MKIISSLTVATALVAVILSGCATRSDLLSQDIYSTYISTRTPKGLLSCFQKNISENRLRHIPSQVIDAEDGKIELVIQTASVIMITSTPHGSKADFRIAGHVIKDQFIELIVPGCE